MTTFLNYDYLVANHTMVHSFGLGFIQVKLSRNVRVHFYTHEAIVVSPEEIHNHRYGFTSQVLSGNLTHILYDVVEDRHGQYVKRQVSCDPTYKGDKSYTRVGIASEESCVLTQYDKYTITHDQFHRVEAVPGTITLVTRDEGYAKQLADVVSPVGAVEVCPFSVDIGRDECFRVIREMLR